MRGKHGISAAAKRAVADAETSVETYQRAVARLTAENKQLKEKLAAQDRAHSKEVRILKTQRDEGLSPTLSVVQAENVRLKERLDIAQRSVAEWGDYFQRLLANRLFDYVQNVEGLTKLEAIEKTLALIGESPAEAKWTPPELKHVEDLAKLNTLVRAKGWKR